MASQLTYCFIRTVVQVLMGLFFTMFQSPDMSGWFMPKLWKVAWICKRYGQNTVGSLFRTRCISGLEQNKRPPNWNSILLVSISTISTQSACHSAPVCQILSK